MGSHLLKTLSQAFLFFIVLAVLGITIASLVLITNLQNKQDDIFSAVKSPSNQQTQQSTLNIPSPPKISSSEGNKFSAYNKALQEFQYSVDFTADPCNDFYAYACGNYKKPVSIYDMTMNNYNSMLRQFTNPDYQKTINSSSALTKEKQFFDACVAVSNDPNLNNKTLVSKNYLMKKVSELSALIGSNFTIVFGGSVNRPSNTNLGKALGYLSFQQGIDTYVTPMVDTFWRDNSKGYQFFIDQNTAEMSKTYYSPAAFATVVGNYIASTTSVLQTFCEEQNMPCPNLEENVKRLIYFEQIIANNYSTPDNVRRQFARSWNLMTVSKMQAEYSFIDWSAYTASAPEVARDILTKKGYNISVMEMDMMKKLSNDFPKMDQDSVVNYLFMRLILDSAQYLPSYSDAFANFPMRTEGFKIGKERSDRRQIRSRSVRMDVDQEVGINCISMADDMMTFANGRVFVDNIYPNDDAKKAIRSTAGGLIKNVINSFQGMLEQLDWMDDQTKLKALDKTNNIIKNIAFPDWILDNQQLDDYYQSLKFEENANFYDMWDTLIRFNLFLQYQQLTKTSTDRFDFQMGPGIVNAWYQPEFNSITLSGGMLQPPFFHQNFPASVNYGGIGIVSGHELTHGFDDQGVQWGPTGDLPEDPWMDQNSTQGFQKMAKCVIDEYSGFCPLDASKYTPNCINGEQTQGENIADNGGIHAAFRAYRTHIALDGPDPTLDDPIFSRFTHDQLFFLNYGQIWCEAKPSDASVYKQLMVDPHSPALYRVFGAIQNFPAFRVAYNCPVGAKYSPESHCRVWVPNVEA